MARTFVQPGNTLTLAAPAKVASGDGVVVNSIFGIAAFDAESGADVEVHTIGVHELKKTAGAGIDQGAKVYFDVSAGECVGSPGTGNALIGTCTETAGSAATKVRVRLDGVGITVA